MPGSFAELERTRLEQLRATAVEELAGDEIELGRHVETVDSLTALVADHPLRERPRELLMLALYRSGRQADALEGFRDVRSILRDQLGMEPGPALQEMHARILAMDPDLLAALPAARPMASAQLPADVSDFVGRVDELRALTDALKGTGTFVPIAGIDGLGGVGKTVLAVRAAHQVAEQFPDGQIVIDGTAGESASDVLGCLLRAVTGAFLPESLAERAAMWRFPDGWSAHPDRSGRLPGRLGDSAPDAGRGRAGRAADLAAEVGGGGRGALADARSAQPDGDREVAGRDRRRGPAPVRA